MKPLIKLLRPKHWVKNFFIFIPAFFAGALFNSENVKVLLLGFLCFSFVASAIYIINDYQDIEADRNHPEKKNRPLAAGTVSVTLAFITVFVLLALGLGLAYFLEFNFFIVIGVYLLINIGYSQGLKNISILDILIVATGFLLRVVAGGLIIHVAVSKWLLIMVFLLALFMALAKRLDDLLISERDGKQSRKSAEHYNLNFIYSGITMIAGIIMVSYIMYTISDEAMERMGSEHLYFTSVFVIAGVLRYLQITLVEQKSGSPTKIFLTDKFIIITLFGWIISFFAMIYLNKGF